MRGDADGMCQAVEAAHAWANKTFEENRSEWSFSYGRYKHFLVEYQLPNV